MPEHIGSLALRKGGGAVVALADGLFTLNFTGTSTKLVDPDPGKAAHPPDDDKVDRQGRSSRPIWITRNGRFGIYLPSHGSTAALSTRNGPAGVSMAGPSISPALGCRGLRVEYVHLGRQARALRPRWHVGPQVGPPVENATSVIFGGHNLEIAYVTSIKRVVKGVRQREREAGGCLRSTGGLGVRGIPEPRFRG